MKQLKNVVRTMVKTHVDSLRDEVQKLAEQNRTLKEENFLHSETLCKLLDMQTEKNALIADVK